MNNTFDVIVVGSGFGGGTVALRLAEAGRRVLVLERGRRWQGKNLQAEPGDPRATPFPQLGDSHFFWGRQFFAPWQQRLGLFDVKQFTNLQALTGAGVGGGSMIWANVVIEAPDWIFREPWPADLSRDTLEPYYRRAASYLRPTTVPGAPGIQDLRKGRTVMRAEYLRKAAQSLGHTWQPVKVAVAFNSEGEPFFNDCGRARQMGCNYCGLCSAGCPQGAKNTVDLTYLAKAQALGAEVRPLHEVVDLLPEAAGYRVIFKRYELDGSLAGTEQLKAPHVVLSAGTFGTTALLLKARKRRSLPALSPAVGTRFSINGNVLGGALRERQPARMQPAPGPAIAGMIDYGDFVVEDFENPLWAQGVVGASELQRLATFALAYMGINLPARARDLLVYVGVGFDRALGRLKLNRLGGLSLTWPGGLSREPVLIKLHQAMAELAHAQGRRYLPNVFSVFNRPLTYHPLGGCPMGDCAAHGVVDSFGRVFGYKGLYVADGSVIPTAIGRNPAFTIAALAERTAERLAETIK